MATTYLCAFDYSGDRSDQVAEVPAILRPSGLVGLGEVVLNLRNSGQTQSDVVGAEGGSSGVSQKAEPTLVDDGSLDRQVGFSDLAYRTSSLVV